MAGFCGMQFAIQFSMGDTVGWFHLIAPYNLCYFVLGMLAHRLWPVVRRRLHPKFVLSLAALPIIVWTIFQITSTKQASPIIWLAFAATIPALFELTKDGRFDAKLGAYSYPVYLVHFLFCSAMTPLGNFGNPVVGGAFVGLANSDRRTNRKMEAVTRSTIEGANSRYGGK